MKWLSQKFSHGAHGNHGWRSRRGAGTGAGHDDPKPVSSRGMQRAAAGAIVVGANINKNDSLFCKATKVQADTALAHLLVDKAAQCLLAIFASVYLSVLPAQAAEAPMTSMKKGDGTSQAARQAASMTEIMGAPGLVPFDVMTGQAGKWMLGYQFMFEEMGGNLVGANRVSNSEVLGRFFATPTDMTMQMNMAMVMYAPTDKLTLMAMLPYIRKNMNHITVDGARFAERAEGLGDIELRGMFSVYDYEMKGRRHRLLLSGGVGLPTGAIDAKMGDMRLEYPMQIGSGTFSMLPGITYLGQSSEWGWAADFHSTVRFGRNDNGYRLGNRYQSSVSIARQLPNSMSLSAGARGVQWENIHGSDSLLDPADEPTKDPHLQGGKRLSALLGINFHPENGLLKGQHFHVQGEIPVAQSLDGPQLQRSWVIRAGWQREF